MPASNANLISALVLPFLVWRIYRRFHRNVGRQVLHPRRLITGIVVFALVAVLLLAGCAFSPRLLAGLGGGLLLGLPLAWWGLSLTRFEIDPTGQRFYTPNTYIGVALTLLLAGRVLYRVGVLYFSDPVITAASPAFMQSPLTLLLIGVTAGYYIAYNSVVLRHRQ
jgi:hypothetical protein